MGEGVFSDTIKDPEKKQDSSELSRQIPNSVMMFE